MKRGVSISTIFVYILLGIFLSSCNVKTTTISTQNSADKTDECILKDEICSEALDFQKEYERLPDDEKKDMANVLETYVQHCEEAKKKCEKSKKKK